MIVVFVFSLLADLCWGLSSSTVFDCSCVNSTSAMVGTPINVQVLALSGNSQPVDPTTALTLTLNPIVYNAYYDPIPISSYMSYNYISNDGHFIASVTSVLAIEYNLVLTDSQGNTIGSSCNVTFTPGPYVSTSTVALASGEKIFSSAAAPVTVNFVTADSSGNPMIVPSSKITVIATLAKRDPLATFLYPATVVSAVNYDSLSYGYPVLQVSLTCNVTGSISFKLYINQLKAYEANYINYPGTESPSTSTAVWSFFSKNRGASETFRVQISENDICGNQITPSLDNRLFYQLTLTNTVTGANITYSSTSNKLPSEANNYVIPVGPVQVTGVYIVSISSNGVQIAGSPYPKQWTVTPGVIDATQSYIQLSNTTSYSTGTPYLVVINALDSFGNNNPQGADVDYFSAELIRSQGGIFTPSISSINNQLVMNIEFPSSGNYSLIVSWNFQVMPMCSVTNLYAQGYSSANNSLIYGDGLSGCKQGNTCRFIVWLKDDQGQDQVASIDNLVVAFKEANAPQLIETKFSAAQYAYSYTPFDSSTLHLTVTLNGVQLGTGQFQVSMALSDNSVTILVGAVGGAVIVMSALAFVLVKQYQLRRMRLAWEKQKDVIYEDYRVGQRRAPSINQLDRQKSEEWNLPDDDENAAVFEDRGDWNTIKNWVKKPHPE